MEILKVTCEDGFEVRSVNEKEVIEIIKGHMKKFHGVDLTAEDVIEMIEVVHHHSVDHPAFFLSE
ncbi:MAG TPA: DUF1059 domain-containing protein [Candidatus Nanoarchaeia archaeon]|nr:DUF1059 domain-containing protein [Candidatus Nanoarchaeia archaeon]